METRLKSPFTYVINSKKIIQRPVNLTILPDPRKTAKDGRFYLTQRITENSKLHYLNLPIEPITTDEWNAIVMAKKNKKIMELRKQISDAADMMQQRISVIMDAGVFAFDLLKVEQGRSMAQQEDFLTFWKDFIATKGAGTRASYENVYNSFVKFYAGQLRKSEVKEIAFSVITPALIKKYADGLSESVSVATSGIYLRSLRAVINAAIKDGKLNPIAGCFGKDKAVQIKKGGRRKEDYLTTGDILKLWGFQTTDINVERAVKSWLLLYCFNGCNLIDLAKVTYGDSYFRDNEFSFVRTKTANTAMDGEGITVRVPIIEQLSELMKYFDCKPKKGARVFPWILGDVPRDDMQIRSRIHDVNRFIRKGLQKACSELGIEGEPSPHFARNSFQTALKRHYVPFAYLKEAAGHSDGGDITEGYQAEFTPKQRLKFNKKLFILPQEEDDDE